MHKNIKVQYHKTFNKSPWHLLIHLTNPLAFNRDPVFNGDPAIIRSYTVFK